MPLVLADVYRVPRLARACTVCLCVTRKGFSFACKLAKNACLWLSAHDTCNFKCGYSAHKIEFKSYCAVVV